MQHQANHLFHLCPGISVLLHQHACAVAPVQVPVFQAMYFVMLVNVCAELVARPAPAELPSPVPFWLVVPRMRGYVVEANALRTLGSFRSSCLSFHSSSTSSAQVGSFFITVTVSVMLFLSNVGESGLLADGSAYGSPWVLLSS